MRFAVLDLGTNTFNLLIAELFNKKFKIIYNNRIAVKIGEGGIEKNIIAFDAFQRGLNAIAIHKTTIEAYQVKTILAYGTSALRTAKNANEFKQSVKKSFDIKIEIISGEKEAEYISKGVIHSISPVKRPVLILDIGGGSNEFIIADQNKIYWKRSYQMGMARLIEHFSISDPITFDQIKSLENHFNSELQDLYNQVDKYKPSILVGAEGSFESFFLMINQIDCDSGYHNMSVNLSIEDFYSLHEKLTHSILADRLQMKGLEVYRAEMIVPASIFVNFVLKKLNINKIIVSFYSLKEGAAISYLRI